MPSKAVKKRRVKKKTSFDKQVEDFGKEMEAVGKRIEKRGDEWDSWFHRTFGIIGPIMSRTTA